MTTSAMTPTLDRRGKTITTYIIFDASEALDGLAIGDRIELHTDAFPPIARDVEAWCRARRHRLIDCLESDDGFRFTIEKGEPPHSSTSLAMVISMDGLEELLSPLAFSLAAALEGMEVNLYFQGPAVRVLTHDYRPKLTGWGRPFSRFAAAGMAKSGHIAPHDKLMQLRSLGAQFYVCGGSMPHFKVKPEDLIFDDLPLVEYFTFMAVMARSDVQIYS